MSRALTLLLVVAFIAVPFAAGCVKKAGTGTPTPTTPTTPASNGTLGAPVTLALSTSGNYPVNPGFDKTTLSAAAGATVTVTLTNTEPALPDPVGIQHDFVVEKVTGSKMKNVAPGAKGTVTFTAPAAGTYKYYCDIGDHRARGMEGTLTVK